MTFYHFTSAKRWLVIERAGVLRPTESNVGSPMPGMEPSGAGRGPNVVWLLDTPDPSGYDHGLLGSCFDKRAVRIEVNVPAIPWLAWAPAEDMNPQWRQAFIEVGGGPEAVKHWYVWPALIRAKRWIAVTEMNEEHA